MKIDQDQYLGYGPDSLFWALNSQSTTNDNAERDAVTYQKRSLPNSVDPGNLKRENIERLLLYSLK